MSSSMSLKEKAVFSSLFVVALYVVAVVLWFTMQESAWKRAAKDYARQVKKYADEERLIGERNKWADAYETEKSRMPTFDMEAYDTDTTWIRKMDDFAAKYHVVIAQTDIGDEVEAGDVLERTITVKNFEGSLESLVKFMYELENSDKGMFDMKSLNLKPSSKRGYLKGSFTITCAYMKRDDSSGGSGK